MIFTKLMTSCLKARDEASKSTVRTVNGVKSTFGHELCVSGNLGYMILNVLYYASLNTQESAEAGP